MTALPPDVVANLERENARLQAELRAARDRQAASAEILRTIADTPGDAEQSLRQIAETTARLFGAPSVTVMIAEGDQWGKTIRVGDGSKRIGSNVSAEQLRIGGPNLPGTVVHVNRQIHIPDLDNVDAAMADWPGPPLARAAGAHVVSGTPLRREGRAIGALIVFRDRPLPFTPEELALQQSFADQAVIAIENARLFNETKEALEQQKASADILSVISNSVADTQPVFDKILSSIEHLFGGDERFVLLAGEDGLLHIGAVHGPNAERTRALFPVPLQGSASEVAMRERRLVAHADVFNDPGVPPVLRETARRFGRNYSMVVAPMLWEDRAIGAIFVGRTSMEPFGDKECALLRTFADQAVIAIQNARLFNETREALERQTATADILNVIASSPSDVQPVFKAIAASSNSLIGGFSTAVFRFVDGFTHLEAFTPTDPAADEILKASFPRPLAEFFQPFELAHKGEAMQIADTETSSDTRLKNIARARGYRSMLFAPLMSNGAPIGVISVTRKEPGSFAAHHVQLLQTFADQAVIAIQNARLFNETREALERQTATADILKVIASSPSDVQPVFDAIATSAKRLLGGFSATVVRFVGDALHLVALTPTNPAADEALRASFPMPLAKFSPFELVRGGETVQFPDTESEGVPPVNREMARLRGYRSMVFTPLMSNGTLIGMISVTRKERGSFTAHYVQLLQTFADQAVIAIENVRLFDEVQARTEDLRESLQQQTATADVLKVISRSAFDLQTVFDTLISSAIELSGAVSGTICVRHGDVFPYRATVGTSPEFAQFLAEHPAIPGRHSTAGRVILSGEVVCIPDVLKDSEYRVPVVSFQIPTGSSLGVPLLRNDKVEGALVLVRAEPGDFDQRQIELVKTFADQAVIAIENVRLFDEVQAKTADLSESLQQQTATADVLKVISRSVFDLQTVLDTLVESAYKLCGAGLGLLYLRGDEAFECKAIAGTGVAEASLLFKGRPIRAGRGTAAERVILTGEVQSVTDFFEDPDIDPKVREMIQNAAGSGSSIGQLRSTLAVPMTRDGAVIGVIAIVRSQTGPFPPRQTELLRTFADQAVIAIENARLFDEVRARTRELAASLDELRAAQDRLVQTEKLASLGQLTAGIAHEIKNPLNFVNNFSALSAELTDELNDVLKSAALGDKTRNEIEELTRMLKDNLQKIVQHGKRADSIVKNMLLHSREGSGEHRPADINALLDESLNLAYHGARAEKPQFNVTLQRDFDDMAGTIELFPQEITRVFLNLISNGFYAVTKRKTDNGGTGFDPVLRATTKNLGDTVEIRIRDNGTGIPAEVKDKMFNPFFTTKPAGEGTGLGLSMSHDIIVKQHGGTIDVETEPGRFTEFRIVLPRTSHLSKQS